MRVSYNTSSTWRKLDWALLGMIFSIAICGLILIYSASHHSAALSHLVWKQAAWLLLGLAALSFFAIIDYHGLIHASYLFYGVILILLLGLLVFGKSRGGSTRWYHLGIFYFQPSELAKLVLILTLTRYLSENSRALHKFATLVPALLLTALLTWLILRQPDLGTAMVLLPIAFAMLYVAGAKPWHLGGLVATFAVSLPLIWRFLKPYQKRRVFSFLNPEADALGSGYNAIQSGIAIGSGGVTGKGYLQGTQSQLNFVPMHHTDFIFSVLAEEWGLFGCTVILVLYLALLLQALKIASQARELRGTLIATGVAAMIASQVAFNIGMTSGVLPVTGITLPLLSYGGSSVLTILVCLGILLNIRRESAS